MKHLVNEKSVSKSQQRFMGMVHTCQKSGDCASPAIKKAADSMKKKDAEDFASTKHKGLPEKKRTNEMTVIKPTFVDYLSEMDMDPEGISGDAMELYRALSPKGQAKVRHYMMAISAEEGDIEKNIGQEYDSEMGMDSGDYGDDYSMDLDAAESNY